MYITNADYEALKAAIELLPEGEAYKSLDHEKQNIIAKADTTLIKLAKKKESDNKKIAAYIAEKRKANKNYAR